MTSSTTRNVLAATCAAGLLLSVSCAPSERMQPQTPSTTTTTSAAAPADESREGAVGAGTAGMPAPVSPTSDVPQGAPASEMGVGTNGSPAAASPPAAPVVNENPVTTSDATIVAAIKAANRAILEQAREAVKKARDARVRQLASQILDTFGAVGSQIDAVESRQGITPRESPMSDDVKRRGETLTHTLRSAQSGSRFDRNFVDGQVDEIQRLLELIDRESLKPQSEDLRRALTDLRQSIADSSRSAAEVRSQILK